MKKVHDDKGAFFAIANEDHLEKILSEESRDTFRQEGFEIVPQIEYNSLKTIVVRHLDYMIDSYTEEDIMEGIERLNQWATIESIYRIPNTSKMLKVRFQNQQMVQVAIEKGIVILHQHIPHWNIEKELFICLTPFRNCYQYNHREKDCKEAKTIRCTFQVSTSNMSAKPLKLAASIVAGLTTLLLHLAKSEKT